MKDQFSGVSTDDAAVHLNNFVELCEMQKYKDVDGDIIKLKLFPFSLRGRAKDWLLVVYLCFICASPGSTTSTQSYKMNIKNTKVFITTLDPQIT
jgi:hypothetical protein